MNMVAAFVGLLVAGVLFYRFLVWLGDGLGQSNMANWITDYLDAHPKILVITVPELRRILKEEAGFHDQVLKRHYRSVLELLMRRGRVQVNWAPDRHGVLMGEVVVRRLPH